MSTEHVGDTLTDRWAQLQGTRSQSISDTVRVSEPSKIQPIIIKPTVKTYEELETILKKVINYDGVWITVVKLYEAGMGAELETAAEIALATAKKSPFNMFAAMISKKSGNWEKRTLQIVHDTWEVRRNAMEVLDKLKLGAGSAKAILAIAWRLRGNIIRLLALATEQGSKIRNPIGLFFALTKKPKPAAT